MKQKYIYLIFSFILINSLTYSQITITQSDFTSFYSIGNIYTNSSDTTVNSINIGNPGGGNTWDFSSFVPSYSFETEFMLPSSTPYADSFMTANIAGYFTLTTDLGNGSSAKNDTWSYYNANDATTIGNVSLSTTTDSSGTSKIESITRHFPAFSEYDFPLQANKMWEIKDSSITQIYAEGLTGLSTKTITSSQIHIDAWGTMTMPGGKVVEALRSREVETSTYYFFGIPNFNTSTEYVFIGKNGEIFSVDADDDNPLNSGIINGSLNWSGGNITDVEKLEELPTEFALAQNYPNPFNPSTTLEYSITKPSFVILSLYDVLGNELVKLVNEEQTAGKYNYKFNGSDLASGTYLLQLKAGTFNDVKKIVLLK